MFERVDFAGVVVLFFDDMMMIKSINFFIVKKKVVLKTGSIEKIRGRRNLIRQQFPGFLVCSNFELGTHQNVIRL